MSWEDIKLQMSDELKQLLDERHISEREIKKVIDYAETAGKKLYEPETNRFLAKLQVGLATFYVEYSVGAGDYLVHTAYAHKAEVVE